MTIQIHMEIMLEGLDEKEVDKILESHVISPLS